jgi:hypothetical protein
VARVVLEKEFHLSYPFPIQDDGQLFLLPEAQQTRELRLWSCKEFPANWLPSTQLLDDSRLSIQPSQNSKVSIISGSVTKNEIRAIRASCSVQARFMVPGNIILQSIRHHWTGRNGGAILQIKGELWRPCKIEGEPYGAGLVLRKSRLCLPSTMKKVLELSGFPNQPGPTPTAFITFTRIRIIGSLTPRISSANCNILNNHQVKLAAFKSWLLSSDN